MLDDLEKEIVTLTELFDELNVKLSPVLQASITEDSPCTAPPPSPPRSVVCVRVEDLYRRVINLKCSMSETLARVDLP